MNNNLYDFIIEKTDEYINIKNLNYEAKFNKGNLSELFSLNLNSIIDEYNFILNLFINNKVSIYEHVEKSHIILNINNNNKITYIYLLHNSQNKNFIINKYYNTIKKLENNFNINILNNNHININIDKIQLTTIKNIEAYCINPYNNSFVIFNSSFSGINYLIYVNNINQIISYDIDTEQIVTKIDESQNKEIKALEYILDKKNKRDLLMLIFRLFNNIIIYNIKNWEVVINIDKINSFNFLNFATFFFDNKINELFIISSSGDYSKKSSNINILDLTGKLHKEIKNSNETTNCIKILYDDKSNKVYIIALNENCIKSYDYDQNILYKKYSNKDTYVYTYNNLDIIKTNYGVTKLITSSSAHGIIFIWNFHSGNLLNKINIEEKFFSMFLYNERSLFIGSMKGNLIIIDLLSQETKKFEKIHKNYISCINSFSHKKKGKCLITHGNDNFIKIFKISE